MPPEYFLLDEEEYDVFEYLELDTKIKNAGDIVFDENSISVPLNDQWIVAPGYEARKMMDFCILHGRKNALRACF